MKASSPAAAAVDSARGGFAEGHLGGMFSTGLQEMMQKEAYSCVHLEEEMHPAGTGLSQKPGPHPLQPLGEGKGWEERRDSAAVFSNLGLDVATLAYS